MFVKKKIHQDVFNIQTLLRLNFNSTIHNIAFSSENAVSSKSGVKYRQIIQALFYKQKQSKTVLNKYFGGFGYTRTTVEGLCH